MSVRGDHILSQGFTDLLLHFRVRGEIHHGFVLFMAMALSSKTNIFYWKELLILCGRFGRFSDIE